MHSIKPAIIGSGLNDVQTALGIAGNLSPTPTLHVDFLAADFAAPSPLPYPVLWDCVEQFAGDAEVHLQTHELRPLVDRALTSRAVAVTVPVEVPHSLDYATEVRAAGKGFGLAISPSSDLRALTTHLETLDLIVVMSSEPGTSDFQPDVFQRVSEIRSILTAAGRADVAISVDGGVRAERIRALAGAGADASVCASAVFAAPQGIEAAISNLLQLANR